MECKLAMFAYSTMDVIFCFWGGQRVEMDGEENSGFLNPQKEESYPKKSKQYYVKFILLCKNLMARFPPGQEDTKSQEKIPLDS